MISDVVDLLNNSHRPLILLGAGARNSSSEIIAFAEKYRIPIETTWNAIDLIEWEHPLFIGRPGIVATRAANLAIHNCDLLLSIGARLDVSTIAFEYNEFAPKAVKVLVDIDPSEAKKIPNLDLFINQDASLFIQELKQYEFPSCIGWLKQCTLWKSTYGVEGTTVTYQLCEELGKSMTDEVLVMDTAGNAGGSIFPAFFKQKKQRVILTSCGLGSMGGGISISIGVAIASNKRVVCVSGDGSFCQNIQELEVVRRLSLPITFFVVCNNGYASITQSQDRAFGRHVEGMSFPDIYTIGNGFGIITTRVSPPVWLKQDYPKIIIVNAPDNETPFPRIMFDGKGNMGNMYPYPEEK